LEHLYDEPQKCLFCGEKFLSKKIKTRSVRLSGKDSDFCGHFSSDNPYFYDVLSCPSCGFAYTASFKSLTNRGRGLLEKALPKKNSLSNFSGQRDLEAAILCYKAALYMASILEESNLCIANLCMRLAWMHRYKGDALEEKRFMSYALERYSDIYEKENLSDLPIQRPTLLYLLGELSFRVKGYTRCTEWFNLLFMENQGEQSFMEKARERWQEIRAERKRTEMPGAVSAMSAT